VRKCVERAWRACTSTVETVKPCRSLRTSRKRSASPRKSSNDGGGYRDSISSHRRSDFEVVVLAFHLGSLRHTQRFGGYPHFTIRQGECAACQAIIGLQPGGSEELFLFGSRIGDHPGHHLYHAPAAASVPSAQIDQLYAQLPGTVQQRLSVGAFSAPTNWFEIYVYGHSKPG